MISFFATDADGAITAHGAVPTDADARLNAPDGQTLNFGAVPHGMTHYINGAFEDRRPAPTYAELRRAEYPPITDLADALYWRAQGDETKMQAYLAACEAVKTKYPKEQA